MPFRTSIKPIASSTLLLFKKRAQPPQTGRGKLGAGRAASAELRQEHSHRKGNRQRGVGSVLERVVNGPSYVVSDLLQSGNRILPCCPYCRGGMTQTILCVVERGYRRAAVVAVRRVLL